MNDEKGQTFSYGDSSTYLRQMSFDGVNSTEK